MRLTRLQTANIGGLHDCDIELPDRSIVAFAGVNGTGKSKLLACLLAPWTRTIPLSASQELAAKVSVHMEFDEEERSALEELAKQRNADAARSAPELFQLTFENRALSGFDISTDTDYYTARECFVNIPFLERYPSFNLIFLPAERRLIQPGSNLVDLSQLSETVGQRRLVEARNSINDYGRLDDQEFEAYAKALCVAGSLPSEAEEDGGGANEKARWTEFKSAVDSLLFPKLLLPLTREHPDELRIAVPSGGWHRIQELSSGERQALIVISRVFRAGEGHSIVAIDEPDAYLHPALSARLLRAISPGLEGGRLIVATHSPSILDSIPPEAIFRLSYDQPPRVVESEDERLVMYRAAGFRASALTQADLLVVTEGQTDSAILPTLIPELGSAALQSRGGRAQVLQTLSSLIHYDIPIIGVVDADVHADTVPPTISGVCHEWSVADLEAVLLSADSALAAAVEGMLVKTQYRSVGALRNVLDAMLLTFKDQAIAEVAQRQLRAATNITWPSPRSETALSQLRSLPGQLPQLDATTINDAISSAEAEWQASLPRPWRLVRGKWLIGRLRSK